MPTRIIDRIRSFNKEYAGGLPVDPVEVAVAAARAQELLNSYVELEHGKGIDPAVHTLTEINGKLAVIAAKIEKQAQKQEKAIRRYMTQSETFKLDALQKSLSTLKAQSEAAKTPAARERFDALIAETRTAIEELVNGNLDTRMRQIRANDLKQRHFALIYQLRRTTDKTKREAIENELAEVNAAISKEKVR